MRPAVCEGLRLLIAAVNFCERKQTERRGCDVSRVSACINDAAATHNRYTCKCMRALALLDETWLEALPPLVQKPLNNHTAFRNLFATGFSVMFLCIPLSLFFEENRAPAPFAPAEHFGGKEACNAGLRLCTCKMKLNEALQLNMSGIGGVGV